ncbi:MAG: hypothetical protein AAFW76_05175 [Pseudomonadota bacterium]
MPRAATILDMDPGVWQAELGLPDEELPVAIISEGSWWREQRTKWRLSYLTDVRELAFPDMFWGRWQGKPLLFCCAYGAPRAVEFAHIGACLGAKALIQIGTCGALQPGYPTGDIIVPGTAACREAVAQHYGHPETAPADKALATRAADLLEARGQTAHRDAKHLTWTSIFAQTADMVDEWHAEGFASVDMETATTFAVARHFGTAAVSMLVVWDELLKGRSFMDPLPAGDLKRLNEANRAVYEVALELITKL